MRLLEKFDSGKHKFRVANAPFSYMALPLYWDFCAYTFERNGENLVVCQDIFFPHDFPCFFMPQEKKNWERLTLTFGTLADVEKIKAEKIKIMAQNRVGAEYYYRTADLLAPNKKIRNRISQFKRLYQAKVLHEYSHDKIREFFQFWEGQRDREEGAFTEIESRELFLFCLENLGRYNIRQIYVEVAGRLVGLAWGVPFDKNNWVGLHLKVDYSIKGLSRFLHQERARLFSDFEEFTLGTGCHEKGIEQYKQELGPAREVEYFYIATGDKI